MARILKRLHHEHLVFASLLVLAITMWIASQSYAARARMLPTVVAVILAGVASFELLRSLLQTVKTVNKAEAAADDKETHAPSPPGRWHIPLVWGVAFVAWVYLFGFGSSTLVVVSGFGRQLGLTWLWSVILGLIMALLFTFVFGGLLQVPFPEGSLIHLF